MRLIATVGDSTLMPPNGTTLEELIAKVDVVIGESVVMEWTIEWGRQRKQYDGGFVSSWYKIEKCGGAGYQSLRDFARHYADGPRYFVQSN